MKVSHLRNGAIPTLDTEVQKQILYNTLEKIMQVDFYVQEYAGYRNIIKSMFDEGIVYSANNPILKSIIERPFIEYIDEDTVTKTIGATRCVGYKFNLDKFKEYPDAKRMFVKLFQETQNMITNLESQELAIKSILSI